MRSHSVVVSAALCLTACATTPTVRPFDTTDPIPDLVLPEEVTPDSLAKFLGDHGIPGRSIDYIHARAFTTPPNSAMVTHNEVQQFDVFVANRDNKFFAMVLHTSPEGYPLLPLERVARAVFLRGVTPDAQKDFSTKLAQCIAANGTCTTLVTFDNGNALALTTSINKDKPLFLETTEQFMKAHTYSADGFMLVVPGGSGSVATTGQDEGDKKKLPIFEIPKRAPTKAPNIQNLSASKDDVLDLIKK
jgi:hypothetical protein